MNATAMTHAITAVFGTVLCCAAVTSTAQDTSNQGNASTATQSSAQAGAQSAQQANGSGQPQVDIVQMTAWDVEPLYQGLRAEQLIDATAYGLNGEELGEVENIIVGPDGQIRSLVIEAGGFWDIGDTHVAVPWKQVSISDDGERVTVPLTEDNLPGFSLFNNDESVATGPREWKVSELLDDTVQLRDAPRYGVVDDIVFDRAGQIQAVLVNRDTRYGAPYGPYAYPYYGYGYDRTYDPATSVYILPYSQQELQNLQRFDTARMNDAGENAAAER